MENRKTVSDKTVAEIEGGDLYALLSICNNDDLAPLVDIILSAKTNSIENEPAFKAHRPNHQKYYKEIGDEIRSFGGHSLTNLFRRGKGPSYGEIVADVCSRLDVQCQKEKTALNEERLLVSYVETQFGKMTEEERSKALQSVTSKATGILHNKSTIAAGGLALVVEAGLGPLGLLYAGHSAMGPAFRVTAPCVLHIAYLRKKFLESAGLDLAGATVKIQRLEERLIAAAAAFKEHSKLNEFVVSMWAVGYAMSNCDGPVSDEEKGAIAEFVAGASKDIIPTALQDKIYEIRRTPPNFMEAMKYVEYIGEEVWPCVNDFLLFLAEVDGPLNEFEEDFLDRWESYKKRKAARHHRRAPEAADVSDA